MSDDDRLLVAALGRCELSPAERGKLLEGLTSPSTPAIRWRPEADRQLVSWRMEPVEWHGQGCRLPGIRRPAAHAAFGAAAFTIQDAGSLLAVRLLNVQPGEFVCDLCAAPGGKSTAIAEALGHDGVLLANEPIDSRVGPLEFILARHGSTRYAISSRDPDELAQAAAVRFDAVLVDAPCSGQSLVARGKQSWSAFREATIEHCAARQARILEAADKLLRAGGRLVYSTCTFSDAENERQAERFLNAHPEYSLEPNDALTPWESSILPGSYRVWPHRHACRGAFAVCFRKVESHAARTDAAPPKTAATTSFPGRKGARQSPGPSSRAAACAYRSVNAASFWNDDWGQLEATQWFQAGATVVGWPDSVPNWLVELACGGPEVAYRAGETWFPAYALAMRRDAAWKPARSVPLDDDGARRFLAGEVVSTDVPGWALAAWRGLPLGWLKGDGIRGKNHLPKQARLVI